MRRRLRSTLQAAGAATVLSLGGAAALAQPIYRCGPEGRSYSQQPCEDGRALELSDPRTPQQRQEAEALRQPPESGARSMPAPLPPRGVGLIDTRPPPPAPEPETNPSGKRPKVPTYRAIPPSGQKAAQAADSKPKSKKKRREGA